MVLRDDAFPSIVAAMCQGRVIFGNIRKFVVYLMSCNLSEILVIGIATLSGMPLPLLPLQILYLNLVTDVFPAFALGVGEGDPKVMRRPPRDPREAILGVRNWISIGIYGALITAVTLGAFILARTAFEMSTHAALTVSFLTLALSQLWHVFNMRAPDAGVFRNEVTRNPFIWGALALSLALSLAALYAPGLSRVLGLAPLGLPGWGLVATGSVLPLLTGQFVTFLVSKRLAPMRASYIGFMGAIGGIATAVLAIIGLTGLAPSIALSVATVIFGAALFLEGVAILLEYARIILPAGRIAAVDQFGGGRLLAIFLGGAAGLVLGLLALLGLHPPILTGIAVIAFGSAVVLSSNSAMNLHRLEAFSQEATTRSTRTAGDILAAATASGSARAQAATGLTAIVLGILAVVGTNPGTLSLISLLLLGIVLALSRIALSGERRVSLVGRQ
jgi:hypothetical protein